MYTINIQELKDKLAHEAISLIDVRELDEYTAGHLSGAISMPLSQLPEEYQKLDPNTHHYFICQKGGRSAQAAAFLESKGYRVSNIAGGIESWSGPLE